MGIVEESFSRLFSGVEFRYASSLVYSARFKPYNATVRRIGTNLWFSLSSSWAGVSDEIVIGLLQHLLLKILRKEKPVGNLSTLNMQLYDDFIKGISEVAVVREADEKLTSAFNRVNEAYFLNLMERPNLKWGQGSFRKLASYEYHTNTITVSSLFSDAPSRLIDYLMYHELLHKKVKFKTGNGRTTHHGSEFRKLERIFEDSNSIEGELNDFLRGSRRLRQRNGWRRLLRFT